MEGQRDDRPVREARGEVLQPVGLKASLPGWLSQSIQPSDDRPVKPLGQALSPGRVASLEGVALPERRDAAVLPSAQHVDAAAGGGRWPLSQPLDHDGQHDQRLARDAAAQATRRPSRISTTRSATSSSIGSWVATMAVTPSVRTTDCNRFMTDRPV